MVGALNTAMTVIPAWLIAVASDAIQATPVVGVLDGRRHEGGVLLAMDVESIELVNVAKLKRSGQTVLDVERDKEMSVNMKMKQRRRISML